VVLSIDELRMREMISNVSIPVAASNGTPDSYCAGCGQMAVVTVPKVFAINSR
jgi:hypothetical protein